MILPIYLYGAEVLRNENVDVDLNDKESILKLIEDMKDTLKVADGCGLAAPQVGVNKRSCWRRRIPSNKRSKHRR